ncbi:ABC1 kinase family protein [Gordonia sp. (in: high G+C Gram-positive bacteria)]|uniref:ABC1 kinase family protein n=1 Tax=Gordonia sp. (in: high G+C Gram-positive bacteria) TaxID=84139 RepID=UPI0039E4C20D
MSRKESSGADHQDGFAVVRGGRVKRTLPVAGFAARAAGGRILAGLRAGAGDPDALERFHEKTSERYADLLGHSKGVLMKAGQLLSTFDVDTDADGPMATYQQALQRLQADAPPMDSALVAEIVESDLGGRIGDLFVRFDPDPMAAASIGQVHLGLLRDGRKVAVKVQYPGVAKAIRDDLANTELLATVIKLGVSLSPRAMRTNQRAAAAEVAERIAEELDYRREARNIARFHDLFAGHPFIRVPEVLPELCGPRVLTMTFVEGIGWSEAKEADRTLRDQWGEAISYFATSAYRHSNLFNADPHPGNYRFGLDGSVGFVDFGCVKQFPEYVRYGIVAMFRATCDHEKDRLLELLHSYGFVDPGVDLSADEAFEWWAMSAGPVLADQPHTYVPRDGTDMVRSLFDSGSVGVAMRKMTIPSDYLMVSRISMGMNSILSQLQATMDQRDQLDTLDGVAEPRSPYARQHYEWARSRGLPFGLDPR